MSTRRAFFNTLASRIALTGFAPAAKASNLILSWDTEGSDWLPSPDESAVQGSRALFSKGLPHNNDGIPDEAAFSAFVEAIRSRNINELERLRPKAGIPWVDPTAGIQLTTAATLGPYGSGWFGSKLMAGDLTELYWAALCRDIPFLAYGSSTLVSQANQDLVKNGRSPISAGGLLLGTAGRLPGTLRFAVLNQEGAARLDYVRSKLSLSAGR